MLQLHSVSKAFKDGKNAKTILDKLQAEFNRGELTAIMGSSGTGKSTLFNLIAGIENPSSGHIRFDGRPMPTEEAKCCDFRRKNIGFVFQFFYLIPHLTVRENVLLGLEISGKKRTENDLNPMLEKLGILPLANDYPSTLSGGEQQRTAIARSLIHSPEIILADEPTGSLDSENATRILHLLRDLLKDTDKIVLMATHDPKTLDYCDAHFELKNKKLVRIGK